MKRAIEVEKEIRTEIKITKGRGNRDAKQTHRS